MKRNRLVRNGAGITLGPGSHNVIKRNHTFQGRDSIRIEKGRGNLVAHNVVADARRAGIRLGIKHPLLGGAHNVVRRNVVRDSHVDGFLVGKKDRYSLLKHNVARGRETTASTSKAARRRSPEIVRCATPISVSRRFPALSTGAATGRMTNGDPRQCTNIVCN